MTEYKNIIVVQANEAGQPTNLLALGDNDNISDEVLSDAVRDAAVAVPGLKQATGTLNNQVTSLNTATGTLKAEIDAIEGTSVTAIENDVTALFAATGSNFGSITGINQATGTLETDIGIALQGTGTLQNSLINVNGFAVEALAGTGTNFDNIQLALQGTGTNFDNVGVALQGTGTNFDNVQLALQGTGTNFHDITGVIDATASLQSQVNAIDGLANPLTEDLNATGFNILNVEKITGDPEEVRFKLEHPTGIDFNVGIPVGGGVATGTVGFYGDAFISRNSNVADAEAGLVYLGRQIPINGGTGVFVSGNGPGDVTGTSPPDGAALVYDDTDNRLVWKKIKGINIANGAITGDNIAAGTIGDDQIGTIAIDDHTSLLSIGLNRIVGGGNETFLGRTATTGPNGPMEYMTKEQARTILNGGNQEITGNVGINTAATPTAPLQIEDTGTDDAVYIESSDAGSDAGPVITLKRDSASPAGADYLGQLKFKGESSTGAERVYAKITAKIDDPTNGSEDGALEIANRYNGANQIAVRLKENSFRLLNGVELHVDGNTGLGTNNPSEKLDVQGNIAVTGTVDGRDIATDGTKLDGIQGAFAVGTTAPTSPSEGDLWYDTTTDVDELFAYDSGRSKWLGVNSFCINAGRNGTIGSDVGHFGIIDNREMNPAVGTKRGFQVPFDCTVVGWAWSAGTDTTGWQHRLARYDDSAGTTTQNVHTYSPAGTYDNWEQLDLDVDFDQRDIIGYSAIVATSPTGTIVNQNLTIIIKRRTS